MPQLYIDNQIQQIRTYVRTLFQIVQCPFGAASGLPHRIPQVNQVPQEVLYVIVRREADPDGDRALDPVHAEPLVETLD